MVGLPLCRLERQVCQSRKFLRSAMSYVLVTPARNEEATIERTLQAVLSQTVRPIEWVIVSDGSTDRTDEIVRAASAANPWIRLLRLPTRPHRSFAAVVHATETGIRVLTTRDYDYIGLLDADLRFEPDYFEKLIEHFKGLPKLGLAGGVVIDLGLRKDRFPKNRRDVPGAAQFFRRRCFEDLGGLIAVPEGGWDALTCARARMRGYGTQLLTHLVVDHLKPRNLSEGSMIRRQWRMGVRDYALGYYPLFEVFKCLSRLFDSPLIVGSIAWWLGYCYALIQRRELLIPKDLLDFLRSEQKRRLMRELLPSR
jgi:biofilm PGA synthesis N-glycosyltransferase PgaC